MIKVQKYIRQNKKYTRKLLIEILQKWEKDNNKIPTEKDFDKNSNLPSFSTYQREFGTWNNALIEAEIGIRYQRERKYNRKQLIEILQKLEKDNNKIPMGKDFMQHNRNIPSYTTYIIEFESWNKALEAAGFETRGVNGKIGYKKYTKIQLIEILQKWGKSNNKIPTERDFTNNLDLPSFGTYINEFISWTNALMSAGFTPNDVATRSRQGELQTISEFKIEGAVDLSGKNRHNICDGICPKGELFDTKSASLTYVNSSWCWSFCITISQLEKVDYLFLRAYEDKDFTKKPSHIWRVPIEFIEGRTSINIYKDNNKTMYNVENMKNYVIQIS